MCGCLPKVRSRDANELYDILHAEGCAVTGEAHSCLLALQLPFPPMVLFGVRVELRDSAMNCSSSARKLSRSGPGGSSRTSRRSLAVRSSMIGCIGATASSMALLALAIALGLLEACPVSRLPSKNAVHFQKRGSMPGATEI